MFLLDSVPFIMMTESSGDSQWDCLLECRINDMEICQLRIKSASIWMYIYILYMDWCVLDKRGCVSTGAVMTFEFISLCLFTKWTI